MRQTGYFHTEQKAVEQGSRRSAEVRHREPRADHVHGGCLLEVCWEELREWSMASLQVRRLRIGLVVAALMPEHRRGRRNSSEKVVRRRGSRKDNYGNLTCLCREAILCLETSIFIAGFEIWVLN